MSDKRIFYGLCSWWGNISDTVSTPEGIPCCPICRKVGFEMDSIETWYKAVDEYNKTNPGYREFIDWLKGKCFSSYDIAEKTYERINKKERGKE